MLIQVIGYVNFYRPAPFWGQQEQLMAEWWVTFDKDCTMAFAQATRDSVYMEAIQLIGKSHREVFKDLREALARINP